MKETRQSPQVLTSHPPLTPQQGQYLAVPLPERFTRVSEKTYDFIRQHIGHPHPSFRIRLVSFIPSPPTLCFVVRIGQRSPKHVPYRLSSSVDVIPRLVLDEEELLPVHLAQEILLRHALPFVQNGAPRLGGGGLVAGVGERPIGGVPRPGHVADEAVVLPEGHAENPQMDPLFGDGAP